MIDYVLNPAYCQDFFSFLFRWNPSPLSDCHHSFPISPDRSTSPYGFFVGAQKRQANIFETELLKLAAKKRQKRNYSETALNII